MVAAWGMLWLGDWQFHRAEGGNALSWAYTFEWPIFTIFGVVFWAKTIIDEYRNPGGAAAKARPFSAAAALDMTADGADLLGLPGAAHSAAALATASAAEDDEKDDPELTAYNAYLAKLNRRPAAR